MGTPTRYTQGLATQVKGTFLGSYPLQSPFRTSSTPTTSYQQGYCVATYDNDFFDLGSSVTRTITGTSSTFALTDAIGGVGVLTPGGATTASSVYRTEAAWQFIAGQKLWCTHRVAVSSVTGGATAYFGLMKASGGTTSTTDSLLFKMAASTGVVSLVSTVGSTSTTLVSNVATMANATFIDLGFYYNGTDVEVYVNDALVARVTKPSIGSSATTLTNAVMTPIFEITPVATETFSIDYALIAQELVR